MAGTLLQWRRRRARRGRFARTLLGVVLVAVIAGVVEHSWVSAQWRATVVLSEVMHVPVLDTAVKAVTHSPQVLDGVDLGGSPTLVAHPPGRGPWPAVVFITGADEQGRHHPKVVALARGLARAGYIVYVPDIAGLKQLTLTPDTRAATEATLAAAWRQPDVRHHQVALISVSAGASLALLAAEQPALQRHVSVAAGIAPYADLRTALDVGTTGTYIDARGHLHTFHPTDSTLSEALQRSLAPDTVPAADWPAVHALITNRDPRRFTSLYSALSTSQRQRLDDLSPVTRARHLTMPVELATSPRDRYFPLDQSQSIVALAPHGYVVVTSALDHAEPQASDVVGLLKLDGFTVRVLRDASRLA